MADTIENTTELTPNSSEETALTIQQNEDLGNRDVAKKLEGLFDFTDEPEEEDSESSLSEESDDDEGTPDESEDSVDDDVEAQNETQSGPLVAPISMNAEEREQFEKLPPDMRSFIAKRERDRDNITNRRLEEVANERKQFAVEQQQHQNAQTIYSQTLDQVLMQHVVPELQQLQGIDMRRLSTEDPAEYIRLSAIKSELEQRAVQIDNLSRQAKAQATAQAKAHQEQIVAEQAAKLQEMAPEFRDIEKVPTLLSNMKKTIAQYGFTASEFDEIADARVMRLLNRLTTLESREIARKTANLKKGEPPVAPRFQKPNAAPSRSNGRDQKAMRDMDRLNRTGSPYDAAKVFERFV